MSSKNYKRVFVAALLLMNYCISYSQHKVKDSTKTLLWRIEGNGLPAASHMYGTFHILCESSIQVTDEMKNALLQSEEFFTEHDKGSFTEDSLNNINFMKGKTLKELVGNYYFRQIKKALKYGYHVGEDTLNRLMPFWVEHLFIRASLYCRANSYDAYLEEIARNNGKKMNFLEPLSIVDSAIHQISLEAQVRHLQNTIERIDKVIESINNDLDIYKEKDLVEIYNRTAATSTQMGYAFRNLLLDKRNLQWLPVMENAMKQHTCFFAFGCAHLVGQNGMISLLKQKGYLVTPVLY